LKRRICCPFAETGPGAGEYWLNANIELSLDDLRDAAAEKMARHAKSQFE
jgi:hypothetical protein